MSQRQAAVAISPNSAEIASAVVATTISLLVIFVLRWLVEHRIDRRRLGPAYVITAAVGLVYVVAGIASWSCHSGLGCVSL